ncbi:MAG: DUF3536 domain-containing protein [Methanomicrobiaceae archaeon]|nr:DUF3536 domain-containing protein [Methanomicrobiaceae archaeon]
MARHICIHGHFYQPSRENPWLAAVLREESAAPYHDWNDRITAECYAPNSAARILSDTGMIADIVSTYASISFDAGPTLLGWLETQRPGVYAAFLDADRESRERFSGHGSAIAQAYHHTILPLATPRDREAEVRWGIGDFVSRFDRRPEGMWLPECAVDYPTLETLAAAGIAFTILSPAQASRVRLPGGDWTPVAGGALDTTRPYRCPLPSTKTIDIVFYDPGISSAVAFGDLLADGKRFASRLLAAPAPYAASLVSVATDGETYGHHHRFGEMALAYCLREIERDSGAQLTVYGEFLEKHPPEAEVGISEHTSWSCAHGVERWRSGCSCTTGAYPGWSHDWRRQLRDAVDYLRGTLDPFFESALRPLCPDPWTARKEYIRVLRDPSITDRFLAGEAGRSLSPGERIRACMLLEMARHAMMMYTSCGWYFDDIAGIEAVQVMANACRAMDLAKALGGPDAGPEFTAILAGARSNIHAEGDGARIYRTRAASTRIDRAGIGAHVALCAAYSAISCTGAHDVTTVAETRSGDDIASTIRIRSRRTGEEDCIAAAVVRTAAGEPVAGVRIAPACSPDALLALLETRGDTDAHTFLARHFDRICTASDLFPAEHEQVLRERIAGRGAPLDAALRAFSREFPPVSEALTGAPDPLPVRAAAFYTHNADMLALLSDATPDTAAIGDAVRTLLLHAIPPSHALLGPAARTQVNALLRDAAGRPGDPGPLEDALALLSTLRRIALTPDTWESQNLLHALMRRQLREQAGREGRGDPDAVRWLRACRELAALLGMEVAR